VSGWTKVFLATGILFVAIVGFNIALWRRLREVRRLAAMAGAEQDGDSPARPE
jgi:hypothetical protein